MKTRQAVLLTVLCLVSFALTLLGWQVYQLNYQPLISSTTPAQTLVLDKSTSAYQFARLLKQKNYIASVKWFVTYLRMLGLDKKLRAGVYQIKPEESVIDLVHRVVAGDVMVFSFTIIAGTTWNKVANDLQHAPYLHYDANVWKTLDKHHKSPEGLLLADTYNYHGGSESTPLVAQAHTNLVEYLKKSWEARDPDLPYKNDYDLLKAASIIEKETAIPAERRLISGVIVNRLKKFMPLQMDPTVIYALGPRYQGKLSHQDMQVDSPYNSYRYRGLPPTPIAMVGKEAIDAAAHPERSKYLYFVARGDGSHQFSESYDEQRQAIKRYQRKGHR